MSLDEDIFVVVHGKSDAFTCNAQVYVHLGNEDRILRRMGASLS